MKNNHIFERPFFSSSFRKRPFLFTLFIIMALVAKTGLPESTVIKPHKTNFFVFEKDGSVFYPVGANADLFMNPVFPEKGIDSILRTWADSGINTIRFCLDDYHKANDLKEFENPDGSLKTGVITRVTTILNAAQKYNIWAIISFFDVESMARNWKNHPYNIKNGGTCETIKDFFSSAEMLGKGTKRIQQAVHSFAGLNILAWELGSGINVWELGLRLGNDAPAQGEFWTYRMADTLNRVNQEGRMTALSYIPNTVPITLMGVPYIQMNLLTIESHNPILAAQSTAKIVELGRTFRKPLYIANIISDNTDDLRGKVIRNVFWSSVVSGSGSFLSPNPIKETPEISGDEMTLLKAFKPFITHLDLEGSPRPPSKVPIAIQPIGSCIVIEGMQGKDWMFWLLRADSGDTKPRITFQTIEGLYDYHWFNTDTIASAPSKEFVSARKEIKMQVPDFAHDIAGILRLERKMEDKKEVSPKPEQQPAEEKKTSARKP